MSPRTTTEPRSRTSETRHERPGRSGRARADARAEPRSENPLAECIEVCNETLSYCLEQGGDHANREHILSILDCIDTCWYVTGLQARDSELVGEALQICADACKSCEESCEEFGDDDETMKRCADACREAYTYCSR